MKSKPFSLVLVVLLVTGLFLSVGAAGSGCRWLGEERKTVATAGPSSPGSATEYLPYLSQYFQVTKNVSVIVLGKYNGPELQGMLAVRDQLRQKGYDAQLIKDLPEIAMMSNEEKVRLFTLSSKFVVMVDQVPAGHIEEYLIMREQRTILALLRPVRTGSTWMIGDDPWVDSNFIRVFEFEPAAGPASAVDQVVEWAEAVALKRADAYNKGYPWRATPAP